MFEFEMIPWALVAINIICNSIFRYIFYFHFLKTIFYLKYKKFNTKNRYILYILNFFLNFKYFFYLLKSLKFYFFRKYTYISYYILNKSLLDIYIYIPTYHSFSSQSSILLDSILLIIYAIDYFDYFDPT